MYKLPQLDWGFLLSIYFVLGQVVQIIDAKVVV